ncbi:hypothetical protein F4776DRAFT_660986 [Hypoxylon sp. NC0597]|nr:hypothetical protein F4776DRAFT_660986 [Hypoxylon sp. NC0597]
MVALAAAMGAFAATTTRISSSILSHSDPTPLTINPTDMLLAASSSSPISSISPIRPVQNQNPHIRPNRDDCEQRGPFTTTIYTNGQTYTETELSSRTIKPTRAYSGSERVTILVTTPAWTGTPFSGDGAPQETDSRVISNTTPWTTTFHTVTVEPVPFSTATP